MFPFIVLPYNRIQQTAARERDVHFILKYNLIEQQRKSICGKNLQLGT